MKRADMARHGAQQLNIAENALEKALCETAKLASNLGEMRIESKLSMVVGQDAMGAVVEAMSLLAAARGAMVRAHGHLDEVKTQIGCGAVAVGTNDEKPGTGTPTGRHIQVVPGERAA